MSKTSLKFREFLKMEYSTNIQNACENIPSSHMKMY